MPRFSRLVDAIEPEIAFEVLARARELTVAGKEVIELEIGDSPFPSTSNAKKAGAAAIKRNETRYCPSLGLPELRQAAADYLCESHGLDVRSENILVGPGAKNFEQLFCEAFLDAGDQVLVFSPHFPTYVANILRRGARISYAPLREERQFRPNPDDVDRFLNESQRPRAIFLNSPHNPTGGVATDADLCLIADMVMGRDTVIFSDEPYDQMVWDGSHRSILSYPGMLDQAVAAYTLSKTYSMSGWRVGFAAASPEVVDALGKLTNTALSCVSPISQWAAVAALREDAEERDKSMAKFRKKVELLATGLDAIEGMQCARPSGTFYVFPNVKQICDDLDITSHGLAMYLLEGADDQLGVACLGGECFGHAGAGYLRFSCAQDDKLLRRALEFLPEAFANRERAERYLTHRPEFRQSQRTGSRVPLASRGD
jgi:aspartate aminotransferase